MNELFMRKAIKEAKKALLKNELPVGAVIVYNNKIIARGHNKKETSKDSTMHAEIIAIKKACKKMGDWRLNKCSIYVTMEPCSMCMGAIIESRIEKLIYGIENTKSHFINKNISKSESLSIQKGVLEIEIKQMIKDFFSLIRNR